MKNINACWAYAISKLDLITSDHDMNAVQENIATTNGPIVLGFLNAHGFNLLLDKSSFFDSLKCMDIILRDGIGVKILLRTQGIPPGENMNGTDFIPVLLEKYKGKRIAILATENTSLNTAKEIIAESMSVNVVIAENGFHPDEYYLEVLSNTPVDVVLLGMGMPKQERIACMLKEHLNYPTVIICGGAVIDFIAGRFSRAPIIVRKIGMEWLYRLSLEPVRLFKRYVIGNAIFIIRMFYFRFTS